jgi:hypothetical protein
VAATAVLAFFLTVYAIRKYAMPMGYDAPRYLFQTNLVAHFGLAHVPHVLPPPKKSLDTRMGFPIIVLTLSSLFSTSTFKIASVVPGAAATAAALAAGAFVSWALRRGPWEFGAVSIIVGTSAVMVRLIAPETYTDNLLSTAIFLAALVPILSAIRDGPGPICAIVLLGLGGMIHPPFFGLFAVILALVALLYVPTSWRAWRRSDVALLRTPSARLGLMLGGASAVAAVGLVGSVRSWPVGPKQSHSELEKKFRLDVPLYRFPLTAPVAALGASVLGALGLGPSRASRDRARPSEPDVEGFAARFLLALSLTWGLVTLIGVIDFNLGGNAAAHRLLSFLIPFPILLALGILGLAHAVAARTRAIMGVLIVLAGMGAVVFLGYRDLYVNIPSERGPLAVLSVDRVRDTATALAYLDRSGVPEDAPVVFIIDPGPSPLSYVPEMVHMIRSVLPAQRILHAYTYVGDPQNYLAGRPTFRDAPPSFNGNVRRYWPTIQRLLPRRPVALLLASYSPAYAGFVATHPDSEIAPNVALLEGPRPPAPIAVPSFPTGPRRVLEGGLLGAGTLVTLAVIGAGWALVGLPPTLRPFEILALCPAVGIAALVAGGVLVDAAGLRLAGAGGALTPPLVASAGLLAAWMRRRPQGVPSRVEGGQPRS